MIIGIGLGIPFRKNYAVGAISLLTYSLDFSQDYNSFYLAI